MPGVLGMAGYVLSGNGSWTLLWIVVGVIVAAIVVGALIDFLRGRR